MDFLDPKKRRGYNIRLFVGFVLISVAIVLATTILALITAGYSINRKTGQVIQNSLVFINSQPVSANLTVNGTSYGTTNARLELDAGKYTILLTQTGYRSWSNNVTLYGGQVEQLIYPFLFPTNPTKTTEVGFASEPQIATQSPDRHWMLVSVPGQTGSFYNIDITNPKTPITTVTIPTTILGNEPGTNSLSVVDWSNDNNNVLLKDSYQGGTQFIMFNRTNPAASYNLNQDFPSAVFTSVKLDNKSATKLYLYNQANNNLSLADINAKTVTSVLNNVISYWPYSTNQILYVTTDSSNAANVDARLWNSNGKDYVLRQLPVGASYELNMASFNGDLYVVIGSSSSKYAYIYKNPANQLSLAPNTQPIPFTLLVVGGTPEDALFSNSARFISVQSGSQFSIYDIQTDTHYRYDTGLTFNTAELATWMDGNRLDAVIGGKVTIWDFDGTNVVPYVESSQDFLANFNQGYDAVYTVLPTPNSTNGEWSLVRNSLIANKP